MIKLCAFADEASPSIDGQIKALTKNNIHLLEIRGVDGKNILDISDAEAEAVYAKLTNAGIKVWSIGSPLGKVDIDCDFKAYEEKIIRACQLAKIFNCENIRMFSFFNALENKDKVITYLKRMVEIANKYSVKMCHENEKGIYGDIESRCSEILNNVPGLYFVYDPANFIQCHQDPNESLNKLHSKAYYYHIKDALMETGEVVPAGQGDGKLEEVINRLNGDKVLTIEPHLKVFAGYANVDKSQLKNKFEYPTNEAAFDDAVKHTKELLIKANYREEGEGFIK